MEGEVPPPPPPPPPWQPYPPAEAAYGVSLPPPPAGHRRRWVIIAGSAVVIAAVAVVLVLVVTRGGGVPANAVRADDKAFYVVPPDGWMKGSGQLALGNFKADVYLVESGSAGFTNNVNVIQNDVSLTTSQFTDAFSTYQQQLTTAYGASNFSSISSLTVDHEPALSYTYDFNAFGKSLTGEQVFVDHNGKTYFITLTATSDQFQGLAGGAFAQLLRSWHWL